MLIKTPFVIDRRQATRLIRGSYISITLVNQCLSGAPTLAGGDKEEDVMPDNDPVSQHLAFDNFAVMDTAFYRERNITHAARHR